MSHTIDVHEVEYRKRLQTALGADYELRDLIGRGGFGVVYAAWDRKLERDVAVKALRHDLFPTRLVLERFQREAKSVAKLRHPNILPVYTVGEGDGLAFMVMPYIRGESLASRLRRGRVGIDEAIRITIEIARALDAAHRLGIIHRDVKPENILLEGDEQVALLADFGVAKVAEADGSITGTGIAVGSPQYMSPEQGSADKTLDARSDVYSLGAVAYEMLAGRRTFEAESFQRLIVLQFTSEPPSLRETAPGIPQPIADAVMRALAREPAGRWQSAGDFARALMESSSQPTSLERDAPSWLARRGVPLWVVWQVGGVSTAAILPLLDMVSATGKAGVLRGFGIVARPLALLAGGALVAGVGELVVSSLLARRRGISRETRRQLAFGQPRWWQAWYPRALRAPDNVWDQMPLGIRVGRSLVWLSLASMPAVMPFLLVVRPIADLVAGMNLPLPLPTRLVILATGMALPTIGVALFVAVAVVWSSAARAGVSVMDAVPLLFTWRRRNWSGPAALKLLGN